jgi:Transposase
MLSIYGPAGATYQAWKRKFGGMEVSEARSLRALEEENSRLKRVVAWWPTKPHSQRGERKKVVSPTFCRHVAPLFSWRQN